MLKSSRENITSPDNKSIYICNANVKFLNCLVHPLVSLSYFLQNLCCSPNKRALTSTLCRSSCNIFDITRWQQVWLLEYRLLIQPRCSNKILDLSHHCPSNFWVYPGPAFFVSTGSPLGVLQSIKCMWFHKFWSLPRPSPVAWNILLGFVPSIIFSSRIRFQYC